MPRVCYFTGSKTTSGNVLKRRGKAKYLGGVGIKTTSVKKRTFKPNLQNVTAVIDGKPMLPTLPFLLHLLNCPILLLSHLRCNLQY